MNLNRSLLLAGALLALVLPLSADDKKTDDKKADDKKPASAPLVIVDARDKEHKVTSWKLTEGTRRLTWLTSDDKKDPEKAEKKDDKPSGRARPRPEASGPLALVFREDASTDYRNGVQTFIPLEHLRGMDFDAEKKSMSVRVAAGEKEDKDVTLTGPTRFGGVNRFSIEAEVDKGELGVAELKFSGGSVTDGVKSIRFPSPKAAKAPKGRSAQVTLADKAKTVVPVVDLQPLYGTADGERLSPLLFFKKTIKVDMGKLARLTAVKDSDGAEWKLTLSKGGDEETFTLLKEVTLDGKPAVLEGLLARTNVGYKLFPPHTIADIEFDKNKVVN